MKTVVDFWNSALKSTNYSAVQYASVQIDNKQMYFIERGKAFNIFLEFNGISQDRTGSVANSRFI